MRAIATVDRGPKNPGNHHQTRASSGFRITLTAPHPQVPAAEAHGSRIGRERLDVGRRIHGVIMNNHPRFVVLAILLVTGSILAEAVEQGHPSHAQPVRIPTDGATVVVIPPPVRPPVTGESALPILVRPATLAAQIAELAGHPVRVPYSRVVGVFNPRVFLIDTATRLPPLIGNRARVVVFVDPGSLRVAPATLVASTVTVHGVARTLLGMQVGAEVAWPSELRPEAVARLEVRAAILAKSVQTPEGIELTGQ